MVIHINLLHLFYWWLAIGTIPFLVTFLCDGPPDDFDGIKCFIGALLLSFFGPVITIGYFLDEQGKNESIELAKKTIKLLNYRIWPRGIKKEIIVQCPKVTFKPKPKNYKPKLTIKQKLILWAEQ